jgi:limonene-1,2-epoxide hydrolase
MTRSPETVVRELLASFAHPDVETVLGYLSDDVEYADTRGARHGIDEVRKLLHEDFEIAESDIVDIRTIATSGSTVLVERVDHPVMNGEPSTMEIVAVFEFGDDGRIRRWQEYFGRSSAAEAQGGGTQGS